MNKLSTLASLVFLSFALQHPSLTVAQRASQQRQIQVAAATAVRPGEALQLNSKVTGSTAGVVWKVNGISGGNPIVGTVSPSGLYIAPTIAPKNATVEVSATSTADRSKRDEVQVTIIPCATVPAGLVSWWTGDKTSLDQTGANPGTFQGTSGFYPAEVSLGFGLDGTTGYVNIPDSVSLHSITNLISVELWANPSVLPASSWAYLYARRDPLLKESFSIYLLTDGTLGVIVKTDSSSTTTGSKFESAPGSVAFEALQHVAVTVNTLTGSVHAFINGVEAPLANVYGPSSFNGNLSAVHNLYLGRRQDVSIEGVTGAGYFPGALDEITLYSAELQQSDIQRIVLAGKGGKCR